MAASGTDFQKNNESANKKYFITFAKRFEKKITYHPSFTDSSYPVVLHGKIKWAALFFQALPG